MPIPVPGTIRAKLILVVLFILAALGAAVMAIGVSVYGRHKELQIAQCRSLVAFQAEKIATAVRALQDNVRELALAGELLHRTEAAARPLSGRHAVVSNFRINTLAVGGGIWFKPHVLEPDRERVCFYAFSDNGTVVFDESFESAAYHYPTQNWYLSLTGQLAENRGSGGRHAAWTAPYVDDTGTRALMTTVGAGMYDRDGSFLGLATVDWRLDDIAGHIAALKPTPGSFALFADLGHDYILALNDPGLAENPVGASLALADWFRPDAPGERKILRNGQTYLSFSRSMDNGLTLAVNIPEAELFSEITTTMAITAAALAAAILLTVSTTWLMLNRLVSGPVSYLSRTAAEIGSGRLDTKIDLASNDELGSLAASFNRMTADLKEYIRDLNAVTAERERFSTELHIARDIQAAMLPSLFPPFPDRPEVDLYARMLPARQVGGDFYDFFLVDDDHLAVVIADVSGKGVPAALFMVIARTLLRNNARPGLPPGDILAAANRQLSENNATSMFVTALLGVLNLRSGAFAYANAGHNPPYVRRESGRFERLAMPRGLVLGAMEDAVYATAQTVLETGDALFLYTDGVTEAENPSGDFFGESRLRETLDDLSRCLPGELRALLDGVKKALDAFAAGAEQHDDITMLALAYAGTKNDAASPHALTGKARQARERSFRAETAAIPAFLAFVEETLDEAGCPKKRQLRLALAAEEIFANIASHAYVGLPGPGTVDALLRIFDAPARAELLITDSGKEFNPLEHDAPDTTLPAEEREIGGLGVFLAAKNSDGMEYERRDGRNILTLKILL